MTHFLTKQICISVVAISMFSAANPFTVFAATAGGTRNNHTQSPHVESDHEDQTERRPLTRSQRRQACFDSSNAWFQRMMAMCQAENPNSPQGYEECMTAPAIQYNTELRRCQKI